MTVRLNSITPIRLTRAYMIYRRIYEYSHGISEKFLSKMDPSPGESH
jgi:hypothetical protein